MSARAPGVGCGAAILRDGLLLLIRRLKPPEAGHWSLPGGKVDFGERVEHAIMREIHEELGVSVALERSLALVETIGLDDQHWVSPVYLARIVSGEPVNREPDKHGGLVWADPKSPPSPLALAAREAIAALTASAS